MEFLKPTWKKVLIAFVLTIWPYIASFLFVQHALHPDDGNIFSDSMVQSSFWSHTWYLSPLYLIVHYIPNVQFNDFWQSDAFYFYWYPLLRFSIRYLFACTLIFFAIKLVKKHSEV